MRSLPIAVLLASLASFAHAALAPQGELRGRAVLAGEPVAGAKVRLLVRPHIDSPDEWDLEDDDLPFSSLELLDATASSRDGTFELVDVPARAWLRLEVEGKRGARAELDPVPLDMEDLRDVELAPGGSLEGGVLLPPDTPPQTVRLVCQSTEGPICAPSRTSWWSWRIAADVRADGTFRFDGVPAGPAYVELGEAAGSARMSPKWVEVVAGETQRVDLDLWPDKPVDARVIVLANGVAARGVRVDLVGPFGRFQPLGRTGRDGVAAGEVIAVGPATALVRAPSGLQLARRAKALDLAWRTEPEARFELRCGALEIEWPPLAPGERLDHVRIEAAHGELHGFAFAGRPLADSRIVDGRRARFDLVPEGELEWTVAVRAFGADGRMREAREYRRRIAIMAGATATCVFTELERVRR